MFINTFVDSACLCLAYSMPEVSVVQCLCRLCVPLPHVPYSMHALSYCAAYGVRQHSMTVHACKACKASCATLIRDVCHCSCMRT